ncbi:hypothetical protein PV327_003482 [Microctonus hyperodae]|uniref:Uncharacterized protein n=1 Tax=Microctonus hyperodae TaxID=165561 RepID=A0AA39G4K4_MICHY|nr:hypothetical protein PV327_003482 [Microctonus hyperodae]
MLYLNPLKIESKTRRREPKLQNRTLVFTTKLARVSGACEFPQKWEGQWFQSGKPSPVNINATMLGEKRCIEKDKDTYAVYDSLNSENCYRCLIINDRHVNAIQFREVGDCSIEPRSLAELCAAVTRTDDSLYTMFRLNSKPIPCPFTGAPFTFTYKSGETECRSPISHAESCTDSSKLLLKYQACPDLEFSESTDILV